MDSGAARRAQMIDPRKVRIMYAHTVPWSEVWENNPRLARPGEQGDFQLVYGRSVQNNRRPYHTGKTKERFVYNLNFRPEIGELYFSDAEKEFGARYAGRIIVEPHIKPRGSPNKRWPWVSWSKLALLARGDARLTQLGAEGTLQLEGVEFIATSFRMACAVIARARAVVLHEGACHHAAAALGVPGVVIFGGFIPVELTGYPLHRNLGVSLGDACGMREPCAHCAAEMAKISPEQVFYELGRILDARE